MTPCPKEQDPRLHRQDPVEVLLICVWPAGKDTASVEQDDDKEDFKDQEGVQQHTEPIHEVREDQRPEVCVIFLDVVKQRLHRGIALQNTLNLHFICLLSHYEPDADDDCGDDERDKPEEHMPDTAQAPAAEPPQQQLAASLIQKQVKNSIEMTRT
eukprot:CAMPEP_0170615788 /NCGR_PEP_ID=MMETSP0224-20130122/25527_1 /TAXON_ID=285029 /ORGANISM="Togula jolla, Strain CCCM 725" /LENGTH=155 /DNA_ID=CAMNT_0010941549 /DNA_START=248 /DNA_END=716 /DNA_ORIENTATION=+